MCLNLLGDRCRVPDHSLLVLIFHAGGGSVANTVSENDQTKQYLQKKVIRNVHPDLFSCSECQTVLTELIDKLSQVHHQREIDKWYDEFCDYISSVSEACNNPKSSRKGGFARKPKPYWNEQLRVLWKEMRVAEKSFLRCIDNKNKVQLKNDFKARQQTFDKKMRACKRKYERGQALKIEYMQTNNPQLFWNLLNNLGPKKVKNIPMEVMLENGSSVFAIDCVLKKWETDFGSLFSGSDCSVEWDNCFLAEKVNFINTVEAKMRQDSYFGNQLLNVCITEREVKSAIGRLKLRKATGVDNLSNELLKLPCLFQILSNLFSICFECGSVPSVWYQSIIKPIPKSKDKDSRVPLNYRGISLLSCVYKIYSSILNERLFSYLETFGLLVDEQNGFRKKRACIDHIYSLFTIVNAKIKEGGSIFCCFIDFQKAFDCINRDLLSFKLLKSGIDGKFYNALKALYRTPVACVQVNQYRTGWFPTPAGVKQGDVLSPTLFAIYINDLVLEIKEAAIGARLADLTVGSLLYADDIVLLAESENDLQSLLNIVCSWCGRWRLRINKDKTQVVHFRKRVLRSEFVFCFGSTPLSYTEHYKYLGLTLDDHLTFEEGVKALSDSAGRALGAVLNKVKLCRDLGYKTYTQLYNSCVCPVLDYGAGVWGYCKQTKCDAVQYRAMRCFLGVHKMAPKLAVCGDMGWEPCEVRHKGDMVRLWNRLINMPDNRLTKHIFLWDCSNNCSWARELEKIFGMSGFQYIYRNKLLCSVSQIKTILFENYKQKWSEDVLCKPKLRTYSLIKHIYHPEHYVTLNLSRAQRSICAQLRCGILPLALETGRFYSIPEEDRKCHLCDLGEVENEMHFLFYCPLYHNLRHVLFCKISSEEGPDLFSMSDVCRLQYLFTEKVFQVAQFVFNAYQQRRTVLYV